MKTSLGLLEVSGLALAINTADAMAKSAAVTLVGIDTCKGGGWMTIKITGDVAAVNSALTTGAALAEKHGGLVAKSLLSRPDEQLLKQVVPQPKPEPEPSPTEVEPEVLSEEPTAEPEEIQSEAPAPEGEATQAEDDTSESDSESVFTEGKVTCNLCQDPLCPRQKGEPRNKCIHARGHA